VQRRIRGRRSKVRGFAVLNHRDQDGINPLALTQWTFDVVHTWFLGRRVRSQHSIALNSMRNSEFGEAFGHGQLADALTGVASTKPLSLG
jgi:hypothetical protein